MKKLDNINYIIFKSDKVYLENTPIALGVNIQDWLSEYCGISYQAEKYMIEFPEHEEYVFKNISGLAIYTEHSLITRISVYTYVYDSSPHFKGDIYIEEKKIEVPFLSNDIEKYFPDIKVKRPPSKVIDRFTARESLDFPFNELLKVEMSMGREPQYIGSISLKYL
ncbi:hypothetical protein [Flavobacterium sp. 245]|uniref:hypothetical protein n=1 Tax=Flavobacterium sp. 245 TaxID=2512115 RepID=UPI00105D8D71|nr:hypothetical protein [Flavobacterium sp. 245]TDO94894.1 hypothetical protein EV145_11618 [Flavobacterium sp. 245]